MSGSADCPVVLAPTATVLRPTAAGAVLVCGSHGGRYPGHLAACAMVRSAVFNDAGIGKDEAGVGGLAYLERRGIAAAAVSHLSCRIGDAQDIMERGRVSRTNAQAIALGVEPGQACCAAVSMLRNAAASPASAEPVNEGRSIWLPPDAQRAIVLVDSASSVDAVSDRGAIVVTGSHGGLVGGDPAKALRADAFAVVFNDAGVGIDRAGLARLAPLDRRGIAAITVAAATARIGDARSSLEDGIVSAANDRARALGATGGQRARDLLMRWAMLPLATP